MKQKIFNIWKSSLILVLPLLILLSCQDKVDLPASAIDVDKTTFIASKGESIFKLNIAANCKWSISVDSSVEWIEISKEPFMGNKELPIRVKANSGDERTANLKITSLSDGKVYKQVTVKQLSTQHGDYMPIKDIRKLAENLSVSNPTYEIDQDWTICGVVVTNTKKTNFQENAIVLQDDNDVHSAIVLSTDEQLWYQFGEELSVKLKEGILQRNAKGQLELVSTTNKVVKTETSQVVPIPFEIAAEKLIDSYKDYESMYVAIPAVQVKVTDMTKKMEDNPAMQDKDFNDFVMFTYHTSTFATNNVPVGSGVLKGIAIKQNSKVGILPTQESDYNLSDVRMGNVAGIKLPYAFSLLAKGPGNNDGMVYTTRVGEDLKPNEQEIFPNDGLGMKLNFRNLKGTDANHRSTFWIEQSGHHNLPTKSWNYSPKEGDAEQDQPHLFFTVPLDEDVSGILRFSFGVGSTNWGPARWKVLYSTDEALVKKWTPADNNGGQAEIPNGLAVGGEKNFFYFTTEITLTSTLYKGNTLYIKLGPDYDNPLTVNGNTNMANGGETRIHSAFVLDKKPTTKTSLPFNAIYAESFDRIYGGLDYQLGEKLAGMRAFSGKDISKWNANQLAGLSGNNVRERTGYVQIGYADTEKLTPAAIVNNVGSLTTPKLSSLSGTSNVLLHFKAMGYKTMAISTKAKDRNGDIQDIKLEVVGGGTIKGNPSATLSGLDYESFSNFEVEIENATPNTQVRFTSTPKSGEYSRWFIDDIYVVKK